MVQVDSYVQGKDPEPVQIQSDNINVASESSNVKSKLQRRRDGLGPGDLTQISGAVALAVGGCSVIYHSQAMHRLAHVVRGSAPAASSVFSGVVTLANATFVYSEKDNIKQLPKATIELLDRQRGKAVQLAKRAASKVRGGVVEADLTEAVPLVEDAAFIV